MSEFLRDLFIALAARFQSRVDLAEARKVYVAMVEGRMNPEEACSLLTNLKWHLQAYPDKQETVIRMLEQVSEQMQKDLRGCCNL